MQSEFSALADSILGAERTSFKNTAAGADNSFKKTGNITMQDYSPYPTAKETPKNRVMPTAQKPPELSLDMDTSVEKD